MKSENLAPSIKASDISLLNGDRSPQILIDVPAMSGGYYLGEAISTAVCTGNLQLSIVR